MDMDTQPKVRLLLIEDDVRLARLVRDYLTHENFDIRIEHRGDTALESFRADETDIVVLGPHAARYGWTQGLQQSAPCL